MIHYLGNIVEDLIPKSTINKGNKDKSWSYGYNSDHDIIIISKDGTLGTIININGLNIGLPQTPDKKLILNSNKAKKDQKWVREDLPKGLNDDTQFDPEYRDYIEEEFRRREEGLFAYIKGELIYIVPIYYFTLQWVFLDEGYPDFRQIQNELMLYWEACKADDRCFGVSYVKNRRFGWTSLCIGELVEAGTIVQNKELGIISKESKHAKGIFTKLVRAFKKLPPFFKPLVDGNTTPKTELIFSEPSRKRKAGEKITEEEGLDTVIKWHTTTLNAMDGDKQYRTALDECFGEGTKILMSDLSFKNIEDVKIGDKVIVEGGEIKTVGSTTRGVDDLFLIEQPYSKDYIVNSKHRLYLEQRCNTNDIKDDGIKIITPTEYLSLGKYKERTTFGVRSKGINFIEKEVLIDPYILGMWLGDGSSSGTRFAVNTRDTEILESLKGFCDSNNYGYSIGKTSSKNCVRFAILKPIPENGSPIGNKNIFLDKIKQYSLYNNKHIPLDYLKNSKEVRLKLLAGLLDTDGHLNHRQNSYTYTIASSIESLANQIEFLARSLGFKVTTSKRIIANKYTAWRVSISGDLSVIPCKIKRKIIPSDYSRQYACHINKINVKPIGKGNYYGITLKADNDDDRRLILEDFTLSMNCGKWPVDVPFSQYWNIVKTSHRQGRRIVGKAMVGSTVNALKKGGQEFKDVYDLSDPLDRTENDRTKSGLYNIFIPTQYCLEGFFDEYGFSIVDDPEKPITTDMGDKTSIGSSTYLENDIEALKDNPEDQNEYYRQNPRTIREAFRDEATDCDFNLLKLQEQLDHNEYEVVDNSIERGNLTWKDGIQDTEVIWRPDPNGRFWIAEGCHPPDQYRNKRDKKMINGVLSWSPLAAHVGAFGVDPYNRSKTSDGRGSSGSIHLSTKTNTTYLPNEAFILEYIDRPRKVEDFFEDVIKAMVYYSMPALIEQSNEQFLKLIKERGYRNFSMNNPFKLWKDLNPTEKLYGGAPQQDTKIGDQQFYAIESYIEDYVGVARETRKDIDRIQGQMGWMPFSRTLTQWKDVDTTNRTKYDAYISSSLSRLANQKRKLKTETKVKKLSFFTKYNNDTNRSKTA